MKDERAASAAHQAAASGSGAGAADRPVGGRCRLRFYVCVGLLLATAGGMQGLSHYFEVTFAKQPCPLKKPLAYLDAQKLAPEYTLSARQLPPISDEVLENLGTHEYLQWYLDDNSLPDDDPCSLVYLFITYYTGKDDPVPHNPKECYSAGGATLVGEKVEHFTLPGPHGQPVDIPVSFLDFQPAERSSLLGPAPDRPLVVGYFFYANGKYMTTRLAVRTAVSNLFDRYAYYCKIEIRFMNRIAGVPADRARTIAATEKLLRKLMPVLWEDHFQDWEALKAGQPPVTTGG